MVIQDFCDMTKLEEIIKNWTIATGFDAAMVDADGEYIIGNEDSISCEACRLPVTLDDGTELGNIICGQKDIDSSVKAKAELSAASSLLSDVINMYARNCHNVGTNGNLISKLEGGIAQMKDKLETIGEEASSVQQFAGRQKILALNASIEAARTGDAGRGFAVVAMEVQKIALGMSESSTKIANLIADTDEIIDNLK